MAGSMTNDQALRLIDNYLKQCKDYDKDQRYMATSDIGTLLNQGIKLDAHREKEVCDAILNQFDDSSIDVQSIAVRTVPLLVAKSQQQQVVNICTQLCTKMLKGDEQVRNLYAIGLKTCVATLSEELSQSVLEPVVPRLISFIESDKSTATVQDALEVMNDLITRFGAQMERYHDVLIKMAIGQLSNPNNLVRKRAIACLGTVSIVANDTSLNRMVEILLSKIEGAANDSSSSDVVGQETICVQAIGAIGRSAGNKLGSHVDTIVPLFFRHLKTADDVGMQTPVGDDHRENIFQGLESFVLRCPIEMQKYSEEVYQKTAEFLSYDPNFNYDDEEEMDEYSDMEDDEGYSDFGDEDDDTSWKVRRAAANVLNSFIISRQDSLKEYYSRIQDLLQKRIQDRIEAVRLDVLETYKVLLESTVLISEKTTSDKPVLVRQRSTLEILQQNLTPVIKVLGKLMREKSKHAIKTKIASFQVVSKLVYVVDGAFDDQQLDLIIHPIITALSDKNTTLRLEALILCNTIFQTMKNLPASKCEQLKTPIIKCVQADWFKIVAEALRCISTLCSVVRPINESMFVEYPDVDYISWGLQISDAVVPRLRQHDIDQEIKNAAIDAAASLLSRFGNYINKDKQKEILELLLERMKNESCRIHCLKAFERCARSLDLSELVSIQPAVADDLAVLLRQQSREVRQNALSTYLAFVEVSAFNPSESNLSLVTVEIGNFIGEAKDSHLVDLALKLCESIIRKLDMPGKLAIKNNALKQVIQACFGSATLLTGQVYLSLLELFKALAIFGDNAGIGFNELYPELFPDESNAVWESPSRAGMQTSAEACAVMLCAMPDTAKMHEVLNSLVKMLSSQDAVNKARKQVAIMIIGEVGRRTSLAQLNDPAPIANVLQGIFSNDEESARVSAASSLGKLVVGDPETFLPVVMKALKDHENQNKNLILVSLRELLSSTSASVHVSREWLTDIVSVLKTHCNDQSEDVRNMVAECFGKLAILFPDTVVPELVSSETDSAEATWTKISSIRFAVISLANAANSSLVPAAEAKILSSFKQAVAIHLADKDNLEICKASLMCVHALVHHRADMAAIIFPHGEGISDILYELTVVREELKKKVDFGPFKVLVDDGLPVRKSAYACLLSLLDNAHTLLGSLSGQLVPCIANGFDDSPEDAPDVPFMSHQILIQLCNRHGHVVLSQAHLLMKHLQNTLMVKIDDIKDPEKQKRKVVIVNSALRALDHVASIPGALGDRDIQETLSILQRNEKLQQMATAEGLKNVFKM